MSIVKAENARKDMPLVSIVAICYNQAKYVVETLDSIKDQTYPNIQLIIVDDYSTDNSVEIIDRWLYNNSIDCLFIKHNENLGVGNTCNDGLDSVKGEFYQILACDDVLYPDKIEYQVNIFKMNPNAAVVFGLAETIDHNSNLLGDVFIGADKLYRMHIKSDFKHEIFNNNFISAPSTLIRKKILEFTGGYDKDILYEDWDMWLRISKLKWEFIFEFKIFCKYRILGTSLGKKVSYEMLNSTYKLFHKHGLMQKSGLIIWYFKYFRSIKFSKKFKFALNLHRAGDYKALLIYILSIMHTNRRVINVVYTWLYLK